METTTREQEARAEFVRLFDAMEAAEAKADAAFLRYFRKREAGTPTNGAAWQRLENEANYLRADVHSAATRLYAMDVDPVEIRPEYLP